MLASVGVQSVKLPPRSPNLNAHAERFVRSIKESCLNRIIFFGETSLRRAAHECVAHYHHERNQSGSWQPAHPPRTEPIRERRSNPAASAPWRDAELLLPFCSLNQGIEYSDLTGQVFATWRASTKVRRSNGDSLFVYLPQWANSGANVLALPQLWARHA
jgi:Integrase core domain